MRVSDFILLGLPHEKAKSTSMYRKKNFMMSMTIRDKETCSGPRWGLTEKMYTNLSELQKDGKSKWSAFITLMLGFFGLIRLRKGQFNEKRYTYLPKYIRGGEKPL